jgi:hypothetical protein
MPTQRQIKKGKATKTYGGGFGSPPPVSKGREEAIKREMAQKSKKAKSTQMEKMKERDPADLYKKKVKDSDKPARPRFNEKGEPVGYTTKGQLEKMKNSGKRGVVNQPITRAKPRKK